VPYNACMKGWIWLGRVKIGFLKPKPKTQPKIKYKPKTKKGVKLRTFNLLRKPKPNFKRLDLVKDLGIVRKPKTHYSKVGSSSSNWVVMFLAASPKAVLLPTSESEAVR
jgi:hypothetical protein